MASTTFRLFTRARQFQYCSAPNHSYAGGLSSFLLYSTKSKSATTKMSLPKVYFDMAADGEALGRIIIEVSGYAKNFIHVECPTRSYFFSTLYGWIRSFLLAGFQFFHSETREINIFVVSAFSHAFLLYWPDALIMTGISKSTIVFYAFDLYGISSSYVIVADVWKASNIHR